MFEEAFTQLYRITKNFAVCFLLLLVGYSINEDGSVSKMKNEKSHTVIYDFEEYVDNTWLCCVVHEITSKAMRFLDKKRKDEKLLKKEVNFDESESDNTDLLATDSESEGEQQNSRSYAVKVCYEHDTAANLDERKRDKKFFCNGSEIEQEQNKTLNNATKTVYSRNPQKSFFNSLYSFTNDLVNEILVFLSLKRKNPFALTEVSEIEKIYKSLKNTTDLQTLYFILSEALFILKILGSNQTRKEDVSKLHKKEKLTQNVNYRNMIVGGQEIIARNDSRNRLYARNKTEIPRNSASQHKNNDLQSSYSASEISNYCQYLGCNGHIYYCGKGDQCFYYSRNYLEHYMLHYSTISPNRYVSFNTNKGKNLQLKSPAKTDHMVDFKTHVASQSFLNENNKTDKGKRKLSDFRIDDKKARGNEEQPYFLECLKPGKIIINELDCLNTNDRHKLRKLKAKGNTLSCTKLETGEVNELCGFTAEKSDSVDFRGTSTGVGNHGPSSFEVKNLKLLTTTLGPEDEFDRLRSLHQDDEGLQNSYNTAAGSSEKEKDSSENGIRKETDKVEDGNFFEDLGNKYYKNCVPSNKLTKGEITLEERCTSKYEQLSYLALKEASLIQVFFNISENGRYENEITNLQRLEKNRDNDRKGHKTYGRVELLQSVKTNNLNKESILMNSPDNTKNLNNEEQHRKDDQHNQIEKHNNFAVGTDMPESEYVNKLKTNLQDQLFGVERKENSFNYKESTSIQHTESNKCQKERHTVSTLQMKEGRIRGSEPLKISSDNTDTLRNNQLEWSLEDRHRSEENEDASKLENKKDEFAESTSLKIVGQTFESDSMTLKYLEEKVKELFPPLQVCHLILNSQECDTQSVFSEKFVEPLDYLDTHQKSRQTASSQDDMNDLSLSIPLKSNITETPFSFCDNLSTVSVINETDLENHSKVMNFDTFGNKIEKNITTFDFENKNIKPTTGYKRHRIFESLSAMKSTMKGLEQEFTSTREQTKNDALTSYAEKIHILNEESKSTSRLEGGPISSEADKIEGNIKRGLSVISEINKEVGSNTYQTKSFDKLECNSYVSLEVDLKHRGLETSSESTNIATRDDNAKIQIPFYKTEAINKIILCPGLNEPTQISMIHDSSATEINQEDKFYSKVLPEIKDGLEYVIEDTEKTLLSMFDELVRLGGLVPASEDLHDDDDENDVLSEKEYEFVSSRLNTLDESFKEVSLHLSEIINLSSKALSIDNSEEEEMKELLAEKMEEIPSGTHYASIAICEEEVEPLSFSTVLDEIIKESKNEGEDFFSSVLESIEEEPVFNFNISTTRAMKDKASSSIDTVPLPFTRTSVNLHEAELESKLRLPETTEGPSFLENESLEMSCSHFSGLEDPNINGEFCQEVSAVKIDDKLTTTMNNAEFEARLKWEKWKEETQTHFLIDTKDALETNLKPEHRDNEVRRPVPFPRSLSKERQVGLGIQLKDITLPDLLSSTKSSTGLESKMEISSSVLSDHDKMASIACSDLSNYSSENLESSAFLSIEERKKKYLQVVTEENTRCYLRKPRHLDSILEEDYARISDPLPSVEERRKQLLSKVQCSNFDTNKNKISTKRLTKTILEVTDNPELEKSKKNEMAISTPSVWNMIALYDDQCIRGSKPKQSTKDTSIQTETKLKHGKASVSLPASLCGSDCGGDQGSISDCSSQPSIYRTTPSRSGGRLWLNMKVYADTSVSLPASPCKQPSLVL
ncbi:uncharacterized protein LOC136031206 [Artemia franciscana]|uniref:Uncharacterized protein n=1 Tax=Artemia franciscana TaxID=6661 RepID=A0AA88H8Y1_ARTSF|nr:hypothetical protein QYM36_016834 [Artemia franciscana]